MFTEAKYNESEIGSQFDPMAAITIINALLPLLEKINLGTGAAKFPKVLPFEGEIFLFTTQDQIDGSVKCGYQRSIDNKWGVTAPTATTTRKAKKEFYKLLTNK